MNGDRSVLALFIFLGLDRARIREFGVELKVELLARHLCGKHPVGGVGNLLLREVPGTFGHACGERGLEVGNAVAGGGGDHEDLLELHPLVQLGGEGEELVLGGYVDLVEDQDLGLRAALQRIQHRLDAGGEAGLRVDHEGDEIGILSPAPCSGDHGAIEAAPRLEDAGRVDEQGLSIVQDGDPHEAGAGGLRLGADDRDLLSDERVDEGRLARIGRTHDGDEAATFGHFNFSSSAWAAAVSASCLEVPSALASPTPLIETSTTKRGAWWGPVRLVSA